MHRCYTFSNERNLTAVFMKVIFLSIVCHSPTNATTVRTRIPIQVLFRHLVEDEDMISLQYAGETDENLVRVIMKNDCRVFCNDFDTPCFLNSMLLYTIDTTIL